MIQIQSLGLLATTTLGLTSCLIATRGVGQKPEKMWEQPGPARAEGQIYSISIAEFLPLHQSDRVYLLDARPRFYHLIGHLPGAINIPIADCETQITQRDSQIKAAVASGKILVVYCTDLHCPDALTLATHLAKHGHSPAILTGGWDAWKELELPTASFSSPPQTNYVLIR
jgi:rhodanese-related sulfurtransferase